MRKTHFGLLFGILVLLVLAKPTPSLPTTLAQDDTATCDTLIQEAIAEIASVCSGIGRNEACFGNGPVSTVLRDDSYFFDAPGDIIPVDIIETLITRPADPESGEWGIVLMDIQADLPDSSNGAVRLLFYGGVTVDNQVEATADVPTCTVSNNTANNINIRSGPDTSFSAVDIFDGGTELTALGRNEASTWYYTARGWVAASVVDTDCDMASLNVTTGDDAIVAKAPMQAFTVQMTDDATCQAAPAGLLIQSPKGETAKLVINNVELSVGSTAYITLRQDNDRLTISNLEGNVKVTSADTTRAVRPGNQTTVRFNDEGEASRPSPTSNIMGETLYVDFEVWDEVIETEEFTDFFAVCYDEAIGDYDQDCLDSLYADPYSFCADPDTGEVDEACLEEYYTDPYDICYDEELGDYDEACLEEAFSDPFEICYDPETDTYDDSCIEEYDSYYDECYDPDTGFYDDECLDGLLDDPDLDSDEDGLTNNSDLCPFEYGDVDNGGCPEDEGSADSDGDGLTDDEDFCPAEYGPVENDGCPEDEGSVDSDGDGLTDDEDFCPAEYGPADNGGCPADEPEEEE